MPARVFVDTNVLVYSRDTTEPEKNAAALRWLNVLWAEQCGQTSFQVLNEYYAVVTRKLDRPLPRKRAREDVLDLLAWNPVTMNEPLLVDAWRLQERFRLHGGTR